MVVITVTLLILGFHWSIYLLEIKLFQFLNRHALFNKSNGLVLLIRKVYKYLQEYLVVKNVANTILLKLRSF